MDIKFVNRRIALCNRRIEELEKRYENKSTMDDLTYHAGHDVGYWKGKLSAYELIKDKMEADGNV